jgi:hypothetical protein
LGDYLGAQEVIGRAATQYASHQVLVKILVREQPLHCLWLAYGDIFVCNLCVPFPAMRQEFSVAAGRLAREPLEYTLQVSVRIVAVELGGLNQTHSRHLDA